MEKKARVSEKKKRELAELMKLIDSNNTIMIVYTTNVPSSQLQIIRKKLKNANLKIVKKNLLIRALENSKKSWAKELVGYVREGSAVVFSNDDPFDISANLSEYKLPKRAKTGQIAPEDISVEEGPTELMPGPAISEFAAVGIKTGIISGKISIKESKVLVKKGEIISAPVSNILSKLEIKPFKIGLDPAGVFDTKNNAVYHDIAIDRDKTINQIKEGKANVLKLAYSIIYPIPEVISLILAKAKSHADALSNKIQNNNQTQENAQ